MGDDPESCHDSDTNHVDVLGKGFEIVALAVRNLPLLEI
jgi:hypothetical protein